MTCSHAPGRFIPQPIVREFLRALGVLTCADCAQVIAILGRRARGPVNMSAAVTTGAHRVKVTFTENR